MAASLRRQFLELTKNPIPGFRVNLVDDNVFVWSVGIIGPPDTPYQGGYFLATLTFPDDYPFNPPTFIFDDDFFHPNVYPSDRKVCISILHPPGEDPNSYESAQERWNPTQTVESILLSILSLINDPNINSPANVDAGVFWRDNKEKYALTVKKQVEASKKNIPDDLILENENFFVKPPAADEEDDSFWYDEEDEQSEEEEEEFGDK
ncbi:Ubiquitin-conjugating enzyme E2 14 [Lobulomyces angularis]|nr:Ubiquitin-conjugating enzyme E2 14 [Lobulomyces angularis]